MNKQIIVAKLNKKKDGAFVSHHEASLKCIGGDVASCLLSRYYKGFSTDDNLVIEIISNKNPPISKQEQ